MYFLDSYNLFWTQYINYSSTFKLILAHPNKKLNKIAENERFKHCMKDMKNCKSIVQIYQDSGVFRGGEGIS